MLLSRHGGNENHTYNVYIYLEFAWQQQLKLNLWGLRLILRFSSKSNSILNHCVFSSMWVQLVHGIPYIFFFSIQLFFALEINELNLLLALIYKLFRWFCAFFACCRCCRCCSDSFDICKHFAPFANGIRSFLLLLLLLFTRCFSTKRRTSYISPLLPLEWNIVYYVVRRSRKWVCQ